MFEDAIRINGKIAVRFYQPIPKLVTVNSKQYLCDVKYGVSIVLVEDSEVQGLLDYVQVCCGGHRRKVFFLPNQEAINVYLTGNR